MSLVNTVVTPAQVGVTSFHFYCQPSFKEKGADIFLEELCPEPIKIVSAISEEGPRPWTLKV
ncbi:hypothetical protein CROQUDRAFT_655972 [Cronartium quercuum f. sp. fusiforme G11]|uniref:Uncharacterized protein n=1 Tax=Cronartium quercuum f. sp. fusiforme G11 TaxID=708437 RepID=A0A9P6NP11_9BASI|nr:hypothetical protein CROQUDRAFT_655972 [Cronartium quercuum f. sp. fusiforme G11]